MTLSDSGGSNTIWMGGSVTAAKITLTNSGNDLLITDGTTGDQITDKNYAVQTIRFSDGTSMALSAAGSNYTLAGGTTATGTGLNDSYSFASGTGTATISDPGGLNTILLGTGLTSVTLYGSGNDLLITDGVSGDKIDVLGQLNTPAVQTLHYSSGSTLNLANGLTLNEVAGGTVLNGTAGSDTLFGNTGSQTLNGNGGNDIYVNGVGNTTVFGSAGNDEYSYTSGSGTLTINETGGNNSIVLGTGILEGSVSLTASGTDLIIKDGVSGDQIVVKDQLDTSFAVSSLIFHDGTTETLEGLGSLVMPTGSTVLNGTPGADTLTATAGTETLIGNGGGDMFVGVSGAVSMIGNQYSGNNTFVTGTGTTTAYGGVDNDTYSYAAGHGLLIINESGGQNTIVLASGLTAGNISLTASGHDLLIKDGTVGDTITLKNQLTADPGVQTIAFSGGSTEALEGIALTMPAGTSLLYGTSGNDTLTATSGTETITGNGGNDTFINAGGTLTTIGGAGNDIYSFGSGHGHLVVVDHAGTNTILLSSGITVASVSLAASGSDLLITDGVAGDQIDLQNQLTSQTGASYLVFSGSGTTESLEGLTLTMPSGVTTLNGTSGSDTLTATTGTETINGNGGNDSFVGASGNDHFFGGGGNDTYIGGTGVETITDTGGSNVFVDGTGTETMNGGNGNDLYSYASGDGNLTINELQGTDTLKLGTGLTTSNVVLTESNGGRSGDNRWRFARPDHPEIPTYIGQPG